MALSDEKYLEPKTSSKIKIYSLTRAELLCPLCYEIPCTLNHYKLLLFTFTTGSHFPITSFWRNFDPDNKICSPHSIQTQFLIFYCVTVLHIE